MNHPHARKPAKENEQGNMDGSVMMLVQEYFGNCALRSSIDEDFMEHCSIVVNKPYRG